MGVLIGLLVFLCGCVVGAMVWNAVSKDKPRFTEDEIWNITVDIERLRERNTTAWRVLRSEWRNLLLNKRASVEATSIELKRIINEVKEK